jgi:muramoyltetrapeptide carboxypeptidase
VDTVKLDAGLAWLSAMGYRIVEAENLRRRNGFLAGTDQERAEGYRQLLSDPAIDAIFFARGGYGSARILDLLDAGQARAHPKIHLGASDLTNLFAYLYRAAGLVTFYGPMVAVEMAQEGLDWEAVLAGELPKSHTFADGDVISEGEAEGVLVGGCLSLAAALAGTPEQIAAQDAIMFWEDTGEKIYRLDRLLTQLKRSGSLAGLRGMVIGSVLPCGEDSVEEIGDYLRERFERAPFPVACNLPAGHLSRPRTLPLGTRVRLDLSNARTLSFCERGVRL